MPPEMRHRRGNLETAEIRPLETDAVIGRSRLQRQRDLVAGMKSDSGAGHRSTKGSLSVHDLSDGALGQPLRAQQTPCQRQTILLGMAVSSCILQQFMRLIWRTGPGGQASVVAENHNIVSAKVWLILPQRAGRFHRHRPPQCSGLIDARLARRRRRGAEDVRQKSSRKGFSAPRDVFRSPRAPRSGRPPRPPPVRGR